MIGLHLGLGSRHTRPAAAALHQWLSELSSDWINLCIGDDITPETDGSVQAWASRIGVSPSSTGSGRHTIVSVSGRRGISAGSGTQALSATGVTIPRSMWVVTGPPVLPFPADTFPAAAKPTGLRTEVAGLVGQAATSSWRAVIGPRYKNGVENTDVNNDTLSIYSGDDTLGTASLETGFRIGAFYANGTWPFTAPILFAGALSSVPPTGLRADITSALKRYYLIP